MTTKLIESLLNDAKKCETTIFLRGGVELSVLPPYEFWFDGPSLVVSSDNNGTFAMDEADVCCIHF